MRNVSAKVLFGLLLISATCVSAEENRYKSWIDDSILYRFDNQTAEIHKLVKASVGPPMWVKCDVMEQKPAPQPRQQPRQQPEIQTARYQPDVLPARARDENCMPAIQPSRKEPQLPGALIDSEEHAPKKPAGKRIELFNELDINITDAIDDGMRDEARARINGYDKLNVSHTLKTNGDRISGIIFLSNKGDRKIALLELTMFVPVHGKDKPIAHKRFVFNVNGAEDQPPIPSNGASGLSVMKKIDVVTPSGIISGMPDVRVTYVSFQD